MEKHRSTPSIYREGGILRSKTRRFNWEPVRERGLAGFLDQAINRGVFGLTAKQAKDKDGSFWNAFQSWLSTYPEEERHELAGKIYSQPWFEWDPIRKQGPIGFIKEALRRDLVGKKFSEVEAEDTGFSIAFSKFLRAEPDKNKRLEYSSWVYAPDDLFDWSPVIAQGIDGFITEADKRGIRGKTRMQIESSDKDFYVAFNKWLRTQPFSERENCLDSIYAPYRSKPT